MTRPFCTVLLVLTALGALHSGEATDIKRRILALYDGRDGSDESSDCSNIHLFLARPLNYLGFSLDFCDVNSGNYPDPGQYRAIAAWFTSDNIADPVRYYAFLGEALTKGVRVLCLDGFGIRDTSSKDPASEGNRLDVLDRFGLRLSGDFACSDNPTEIALHDLKPEGFAFETSVHPLHLYYEHMIPSRADVDVWRTIARRDQPGSESPAVMTCNCGGYACATDVVMRVMQSKLQTADAIDDHVEAGLFQAWWDLNPFAFCEEAIGCAGEPHLDTTTVCGSRAAYAVVDGDGFTNLFQDSHVASPATCGQTVLESIVCRYPQPLTVGLIAGLVDLQALGTPQSISLARELMAQPNVRSGCHGYAHPLSWRRHEVSFDWPGYRFSAEKEVVDAVAWLNANILPARRPVEVYQWTGDCCPDEAAFAALEKVGVPSVNGGDSRCDSRRPSVSSVAPLMREHHGRRQVYASACNENIYTDGWSENYGGFSEVIESFVNTELPRRLQPVEIYFHFFLAEHEAGLRSLIKAYDWCATQPLCWLTAREFADSVLGFDHGRISCIASDRWRIEDYSPCPSLRFDHTDLHPDLERSTNVLGFCRHAGSLYVSLAPAGVAEVVLHGAEEIRPYLVSSTVPVRRATWDGDDECLTVRSFGTGQMEFRCPAGSALPHVRVGATEVQVQPDADGLLAIPIPDTAGDDVEVVLGH